MNKRKIETTRQPFELGKHISDLIFLSCVCENKIVLQ
jgi:hypothetical protein